MSTITEVDTPATSRLNATADLNAAENSAIDAALELSLQNRANLKQLLYNHFPDFQEYAQSTPNLAQTSDSLNTTATTNVILAEKLEKLLKISDQHVKDLKYKKFDGTCEAIATSMDNNPNSLSYQQFPSHTEYAKDTPGLLDSQSINQCQSVSDRSDTRKDQTSEESSLLDIVNELKKRNILKNSFEVKKNDTTNASADGNTGESLSDTLERELQGLGIGWASSMLKKSKHASAVSSSSTTSSASANDSQSARRSNVKSKRHVSPQKTQIAAKDEKAMSTVSQLDGSTGAKPINLKEFLARELMKHSSTSSSSSSVSCNDSSLASLLLKSYLGHSSSNHSSALQPVPHSTTVDKQRTSTPVASTSGHRTVNSYKKSSSPQPPPLDYRATEEAGANASSDLTGKLFSGESHLSSVRMNNSDLSTSDAAAASNTNTVLHADRKASDNFDIQSM